MPLFPAYAGVILFLIVPLAGIVAFPRVCGGDPMTEIYNAEGLYFSPRMRG